MRVIRALAIGALPALLFVFLIGLAAWPAVFIVFALALCLPAANNLEELLD